MEPQAGNFSKLGSRRAFIKKSGLIAGTALAAGSGVSLLSAPFYKKSKKDKLGIALVGLGYYSTDVLAPALSDCEHCYLAGIVTGTPAKEPVWMKKYGIPKKNVYNYENFDKIAKNDDIDIVYVVLPNSMHKEFTIRAAEAGKHVICEKPMALNAQECREMIAACEKARVSLSIGYRLHYEPYTQEVMRLGQEKVYGQVRMVTAGAGYRESRPDHWKLKKSYGGGAMMDMGVYSLQAARYVLGEEPMSVTAQQFTYRPELFTEVDETTTFQLTFKSGAVANCHTSFGTGMNYLFANADKGWFELSPFSGYGGLKGRTKQGPLDFPNINQQATQMNETALRIKDGRPMRVPGEEGLYDMVVVDAIKKAVAEGKKIDIDN